MVFALTSEYPWALILEKYKVKAKCIHGGKGNSTVASTEGAFFPGGFLTAAGGSGGALLGSLCEVCVEGSPFGARRETPFSI